MSKVVTGKITDYGKAPYKDDEKNQPSFFVEIESENGNKSKFWGVGLENALSQNKDVQKGDTVALVDKGVIDGTKKREWEIEKQEPLAHYKNSIENDDKALQKKPEQVASHNQAEFKKEALKDDAELDLPTSIKNNYVAMVRNRFFANEKINFYDKSDSSSIAFEDRKNTLHTSREDEKTIKAMVEVASSKNWQSITLKGTEEFKQKAWLEASLRGIDVKGYQPNEQDLATLKAKQEERTQNQIVFDHAAPHKVNNKEESPSLSSNKTVEKAESEKDKDDEVQKYAGINEKDLTLVRVQNGLDGVKVNKNGDILVGRKESESLRNTLHFTLNSVVQDHVYGKFSESKYAIIGNLKDTAQKNDISGLSPSDTYFFQKDGKVEIPNGILVVPDNHNLDKESFQNANTLVYKSSPDPEINYKNMNDAIESYFNNEKLPFKNIDMHGFVGERVSREEHIILSNNLGKQELDTNHAASLHGEMETRQAQLISLNDDFKNGVELHQNSNGVEVTLNERALNISKDIQESLNNMSIQEKEYYIEKLNPLLQNFDIDLKKDLSMPPPMTKDLQNGSVPPPLPEKKDDEFKIDVVGSYDAAKAMAGDKIEPDGAGKRVLRDTLTFDKVDIAKLVAYNTVGMVASGGVATAVKGAVIAHEIYKGSKIASKEVGKQVDELKDKAKDGFSQDSKESVGKEKKDTSQSKDDPIELRNEKKVDVINTFKNEVSPELERGVNRKTGIHGLKVILDNYKDKVSEKDLIAIEAYKNVITERYKDNPDLMNKRLDDLGAKVPDIAAGKFNLPEPPVIKQEASIDIEHSKKGDQDRGR